MISGRTSPLIRPHQILTILVVASEKIIIGPEEVDKSPYTKTPRKRT